MQYSRGVLIHVVNHCHLDCCNSTTAGNSEFKGNYIFPIALAGDVIEQNCTYSGKTATATAFTACKINMEVGPSYDTLNVKSCQAKYNSTQVLDNLNEVENLISTQ